MTKQSPKNIAASVRQRLLNRSKEIHRATLTDRHHWILSQLHKSGIKLTRADVEKKFNIGDRQAKRILSDLTARSLIEFKRKPHPGFYVLCKK